MDKDKSGTITVDDLRGVYSAKKHPDVIDGKKTEDEVLFEFLDTFDLHTLEGTQSPGEVTPQEWCMYYNKVSMSIDRDDYFELMMNNVWNLDGKRVTKRGVGMAF